MMVWIAAAFGITLVLQCVCLGALWWVTTEVKAMQKSTHSIQYVSPDSTFQRMTDEVKDSLTKDIFENIQ